MQYFSIGSDVKGPAERKLAAFVYDAISLCNFTTGIAEDRIVELQTFGKFGIYLGFVTTGCEISNIELL